MYNAAASSSLILCHVKYSGDSPFLNKSHRGLRVFRLPSESRWASLPFILGALNEAVTRFHRKRKGCSLSTYFNAQRPASAASSGDVNT